MAGDNKSLGRFMLDGIPPAPRGMPQIEVSFDVDANGILNVTAKDKATGKAQSIKIEATSGLTDADIKKMQDEAAAHADEDKKKKELAEEKNTAEMNIYTAEKALREHGDKVPEDVKTAIQSKIDATKAVKDGTDLEAIKKAVMELSTEMQKIGEIMAKASQEAATPNTEAPKDETVHDVNSEDVKKDEPEQK